MHLSNFSLILFQRQVLFEPDIDHMWGVFVWWSWKCFFMRKTMTFGFCEGHWWYLRDPDLEIKVFDYSSLIKRWFDVLKNLNQIALDTIRFGRHCTHLDPKSDRFSLIHLWWPTISSQFIIWLLSSHLSLIVQPNPAQT